MAPFLASREFPMTLQFVHGGVDRDGAPLHFHVRDGRISGLNGEATPVEGAECVDLQGFAVLPGLIDGHIHLDKSFVGEAPPVVASARSPTWLPVASTPMRST